MMRLISLMVLLSLGLALAQSFSGSYFLATDQAGITLSLTQEGSKVMGALEGNGTRFSLDGEVDPDDATVSYGFIETPDGTLLFEAYLEETQLYFYLFEMTENGELDTENAQELVFERQGIAASEPVQAGATQPANQAASNPLTPLGQTPSPLAAADPFVGSFSGDGLRLSLEPSNAQYRGQLEFNAQVYPVVAGANGNTLTGSFEVSGASYPFSATLEGAVLVLVSDGASYRLSPESRNPLQQGSSPQATNPFGRTDASPIIAQGQHASLSQDNALAFIEALEFSLSQVGYAYTFTDAERQQVLQAMIQEYPRATQQDQLVLSQAREIWTRVAENWPVATADDKKEFILAVFILAFGEETVQQWVGPGGSGGQGQALGSSGGCATFEDCAGSFVDNQTWTDTFNAQGCWAAAGCSFSDGGYTYDDYSPSYGE